jgi:hypothetical protein
LQPKPGREPASIVGAATAQARNRAFDSPDPREIPATIWTSINETRCVTFHRKGKIVAADFIGNSQIAASFLPFLAMGQNPPPSCAKLGEEMGQFMSQRPIDFGLPVIAEPWIERDQFRTKIGATRRRLKTRIPFDAHYPSEFFRAE